MNFSNIKIAFLGALLFYPMSFQVDVLRKEHERMDFLTNYTRDSSCDNPDSPFSMFGNIFEQSSDLFCSKDCPCNGNPMLFKDKIESQAQIIDVSDIEGDIPPCPVSQCYYFDYKDSSMTNVFHCLDKMKTSDRTWVTKHGLLYESEG